MMRRRTVLICMTLCVAEFVCLGALIGPITAGISLKIGGFVLHGSSWSLEDAKSLVLWTGAGGALVSNVVFGWLGDHIVAKGRSRSGLVLIGAVIGGAALWAASAASTLPLFTIAWVVAQVGYNVTFAGLYGLLTDLVGVNDRRMASAWFAGSALGSIAIVALFLTAIPTNANAIFLPLAIASVPVCLIAAKLLSGPPIVEPATVPAARPDRRAFWLLWTQRLLAQGAYGFATAYGVEFLLRRTPGTVDAGKINTSINSFALYIGIGSVAGLLAAVLVANTVVRRIGQRPVIVVGTIWLLVGNLMLIFATATPTYATAMILVGMGTGAYFAGDLAAILAVIPARASGRYLGIFNVARTLPQTIVPIVGPWLLATGGTDAFGLHTTNNYVSFFAAGSAVTLVALVMIPALTLPGPVRANSSPE
ncbi:MAG: MFS transporter [Marmoricola sp.]